MGIEWAIVERGGVRADWAGVRASLNRKGAIVINRAAYERMGEPKAFIVMFDKLNSRVALKPTGESMKHAYPARKYGHHGGRVVNVLRLLTEFGIKLPNTIEFTDPEIDSDGQLILDLRTAKISSRAHSQSRRNLSQKPVVKNVP